MKYIDGVPTSKLGIALVRKCKWCHNIIYHNQAKNVFCCKECKDENEDFMCFVKLKRDRENFRIIHNISLDKQKIKC